MAGLLERLAARQHVPVAVVAVVLVATSPWVAMLRRIPREAGFFDWLHVVLGLVAVALALTYTAACASAGRWRVYFPWAAADLAPVVRDVAGLVRGRVPSAEGAGLFTAIQGLLLLAFLATAVTGAGWLVVQGGPDALPWRDAHLVAVRAFVVLLVLHVVAVALHLVDFVRD